MKTLLVALSIAFSLASCKTVKYDRYLNASKPIDHKLKGYTLSVSQSSFIQALNSTFNNEVVRVADDLTSDLKSVSSTGETSNLANLCTRFVQDDFEKNVISDELGTSSGRIIIQVVESKHSQTLELLNTLAGLLLYTPTLVGVPVRCSKLEQTLRMRIYDNDGKKIIDVKGKGSSEAYVALYYGYSIFKVDEKICLETIYKALDDIKLQLKKAPNYQSL